MAKQPTVPAGIETFDPLMRDPVFVPFYAAAHRGEHGWLTRHALQHGWRERWMVGLWDLHLYAHPGASKVWCVVAHRDGVEQSKMLLRVGETIDHDYTTLTAARQCFADWARHAAIDIATTTLELA